MKNQSNNKRSYRIAKVGGAHAQREPSDDPNAPFVQYGYNDTILLDPNEVAAGKWGHLDPRSVASGRATEERLAEQVRRNTVKPAAGDEDVLIEQDDTGEGEKEDASIDPQELEALIAEVEAASGKKELEAVRQKVIDADYFEEGTVPTTKGKLIQALSGLSE